MENYVQAGKYVTVRDNARAVVSGEGHLIGDLFVVASTSVDASADFEGATEGVFTLPKVDGTAATQGALAYWDDTNHEVTPTASSHKKIGHFVEDVEDSVTTAKVRLAGASGF